MKNQETLYGLMEKWKLGELNMDEKVMLKKLMNETELEMQKSIEEVVAKDELDREPSPRVKRNLEMAFRNKHKTNVRKNIIFPISAPTKSNWMMWSLRVAAVGLLLVTLQLNFESQPSFHVSSSLVADTLSEIQIDSSLSFPQDSIRYY